MRRNENLILCTKNITSGHLKYIEVNREEACIILENVKEIADWYYIGGKL